MGTESPSEASGEAVDGHVSISAPRGLRFAVEATATLLGALAMFWLQGCADAKAFELDPRIFCAVTAGHFALDAAASARSGLARSD